MEKKPKYYAYFSIEFGKYDILPHFPQTWNIVSTTGYVAADGGAWFDNSMGFFVLVGGAK